jgi:hypothetical protein
MRGAIPPLLQYVFMAWYLVKHNTTFIIIVNIIIIMLPTTLWSPEYTKILQDYTFHIPHIRATCMPISLIHSPRLVKRRPTNHEAPHYVIFSFIKSLFLSYVQIFSFSNSFNLCSLLGEDKTIV